MRDLAFLRRDIWDLSWKQGREAGITITSGSGISCFCGVGMRDSQGEQSGIGDFKSYVTSYINCYWPAQKPQAGRNEPYSCVRFQVMNSNRSLPCQVLLNVSSISDIFDACVCNLDLPILSSFSSLSTFSKALGLLWPGWPDRMAVIVIYRTKYATLRIASPYIRP